MRLFVIKGIAFVLIFKLVDMSLYTVGITAILNEAYSYGNLSRVYSGVINAEIAFFGSSKVYLHVNPEVIEQVSGMTAYNLGKDGSNIEQALFTLEEYLLHNSTPRIVVFDGDVMQLDERELTFQKKYFKKYQYISNHTRELFNYSYLKKKSIWLVQSQIFSNQGIGDLINGFEQLVTGNNEPYFDKKDFGSWIFIKGAHLKKYSEAIISNDIPIKYQVDKSRMSVYQRLIELQKKKRFLLILLETPTLVKLDPDMYRISSEYFHKLSDESENVFYLSFFDDDQLVCNQDLWFNSDHLNLLGANRLSEKLARKINRIRSLKTPGT